MSQTSDVETKSDIVRSCYETDDGGNKRCKLLDLRGRRCDQKYSESTRSTNKGIHIKAKHSHCKDIIAQLESIEQPAQEEALGYKPDVKDISCAVP